MAEDGTRQLQFAPFSSALDAGFWHQLSQLKLDVYGLDDKPKPISGFYTNGDADGLPTRVSLDYAAFNQDEPIPPRCYRVYGTLQNTNTMDAFKTCDKKQILEDQARQMWSDIVDGRAVQDPSLLSRLLLLTFADLKKYHYFYWFSFPAFCHPSVVEHLSTDPIEQTFNTQQISSLVSSFDEVCLPNQCGYFLVTEEGDQLTTSRLTQFDQLHSMGKKILLGFCDPCTLEANPGWPLRNFLALVAHHWLPRLGDSIRVICLRDRFKDGQRSVAHSIVLDIKLRQAALDSEYPRCVGWEKNERQKLGPRMINLSTSMDPSRLAESAVDLNLKLMRWRLLPELNLEKIKATKCLLLGAGTLGCNVARCLLGWGVRHITLVDNGNISFSNPVRQSLFVFEDSLHGGRPKAEAAAEALRKIFPGVNATGLRLSIPMPGHSISESIRSQVEQDVNQLERLIDEHDVIYLLMDTRESRWLPSLIGASKRKIVMNAALGFDTYLVLRHGVKQAGDVMDIDGLPALPTVIAGDQLGCYFCNDVVAPGDKSTQDRTLDQQCTVSRPGMSMMAAALAVELLVSILVHPQGGLAAADTSAKDEHMTRDLSTPLGLVPHQIRGFLSRFYNVMPASLAFNKCTACSRTVIEAYEKEGFDFLLNVFNEPKYLEDLTGLTKLHNETLDVEVWELSDDESF